MQINKIGRARISAAALGIGAALLPVSAFAQSSDQDSGKDNLQELKACQVIADDGERLACFDKAVGTVVAATETGELQVIDREDAKNTRRKLFGFSLPDLGIFGSDDDEEKDELFETTITSSQRITSKRWRFTTAEGAVWELLDVPRRQRAIKPGDTAIFKPASMGTYFVRIKGQIGIRGRRIQ